MTKEEYLIEKENFYKLDMEYEKFKNNCLNNKCYRRTIISKQCLKDSKILSCFNKVQEKEKIKNEQIRDNIEIQNIEWQKRQIEKELGLEQKFEYELDEKYEIFKKDVWIKYAGFYDENVSHRKDWKDICMFWKCLNIQEKEKVIELNELNLFLNEHIDIAHIKGQGECPESSYDINNVCLIGRMFHGLLDIYKNPITMESINKQQRLDWFNRIKENYLNGE